MTSKMRRQAICRGEHSLLMMATDDNDDNEEKNICVICLERLNVGTIGAATPCGHCFHEECFVGWRHSQNRTTPQMPWFEQLRPVKCPTCNREANFCRIYLDLDALGSRAANGGSDDDDSSLSSEEEDKVVDDGDNDDRRPIRENEESQAAGSDGGHNPSERGQEDGDGGGKLSQKSPPPRDELPPAKEGVVEVIEINDDDDDDADEGLKPKSSSKGASHKNYRGKAKQLKRRIKVLEKQRSEQYSELVEVQEKYSKCRTRLSGLEEEVAVLTARRELHERERESTALQLAKLSREKCELSVSLEQARADKEKAERRLDEARKDHDRELKKVQASSMSEVQQMLSDHPHLIRENRELKNLNEKYRSRLRVLQTQPQPAGVPALKAARAGTASQGLAARQRNAPVSSSSALHAARQLSAMEAKHQTRRDKDERNAQSKADMLCKVSAHAARFTSRPAGERKPHPLQSLSLLDGNGNNDERVGERTIRSASNNSSSDASNLKRTPNQLLLLSMPIKKRSKPSGHFPRAGTSSLLPKSKMK